MQTSYMVVTAKPRSIKRNSIANIVNRTWTTLANFLFVPVYIHYLGEEAYGLVTFFTTLQVVLNLFGLGLSKTLRREFSVYESSEAVVLRKYRILRSVELIIWCIAIIIIGICALNADYIATKWINSETIAESTVSLTIRMMGVSIAAQLIANLYLGCLLGMQDQILANTLQISWSLFKNIGAVLLIVFVSSNISYFYIWHAVIDIIYLVTVRIFVIAKLKKKKSDLSWKLHDLANLKTIYKFALGILLISVGYAINSQIDKIIITKNFDLVSVGAYNSVYSLSILTTILTSSIGIAVFPRFTQLFTGNDLSGLNKAFRSYNSIAVLTTSVIGGFLAIFAEELLLFWTRSEIITNIMAGVSFWLILGTALSAIQEIPYNYFLARGCTIVNNIQTIIQIAYVLTVTPFMIRYYGLSGAALSWFIEMALSTTIYLIVFSRMYLDKCSLRLLISIYLPLLISIAIAFCARTLMLAIDFTDYQRLLGAILIGALTLGIAFIISNKHKFSNL